MRRKKLRQSSAVRWYLVVLGFHDVVWRFSNHVFFGTSNAAIPAGLLKPIGVRCAMRPLVSAAQSCTLVALKDSPPRCDLLLVGQLGPWHPGQIFWAWSRFSHLFRRNKTWDTSHSAIGNLSPVAYELQLAPPNSGVKAA